MRSRLKRIAERALIDTGIERVARQRHVGDTLVLAYHNVVPAGSRRSGDLSLHPDFGEFTKQLDTLEHTHDVVPLQSLLEDSPETVRPRVAITCDDAYFGALDLAVPELFRRNMPATVFVAPGLLGAATWWDMLADPDLGAVDETERNHALDHLAGNRTLVLGWSEAAGTIRSLDSGLPRTGTEEELSVAASHPGLTLASHTWSHPNLAALEPGKVLDEMMRPLQWLEERYTQVVRWLSYPYGRYNRAVERAAQEAGYDAALRIDGGWLTAKQLDRPWELPRFNVPAGISAEGFRLRLAGIMPSA